MQLHHLSIRTADIFRSIAFYEQLGFAVETQFTLDTTLACWLIGPLGRLELIEIPEPKPAPDVLGDPHYVGYYHLSLLVRSIDQTLTSLEGIQILLEPTSQQIGDHLYQVAFIADPDGLVIELIEQLK